MHVSVCHGPTARDINDFNLVAVSESETSFFYCKNFNRGKRLIQLKIITQSKS